MVSSWKIYYLWDTASHEQVQELDNLFYNKDEPRGHKNIFARKSPWKNHSLELDELRDLKLKN